jgi:5-methyltetrahydrofolate--homocysteine methyltransferase
LEREKILSRLKDAIVELNIEAVERASQDALAAGILPMTALMEGVARGMDVVGGKYERGEYFLSELVMAGETMKTAMRIFEPRLKESERKLKARVAVGTARGDMHDIGKNIVLMLLQAAGFGVIDLGVDVAPEAFVEAVREHKIQIVGMSSLLTTTMREMHTVIKQLEEAGLRTNLKITIGGAPITAEFAKEIAADYAARDAVDGVNMCKKWIGT